jgi:hypothetical protein
MLDELRKKDIVFIVTTHHKSLATNHDTVASGSRFWSRNSL